MPEKFDEIDVERINVVDPDGTLRLTISNRDRLPDAVMDGQFLRSRKGEAGAGFIFFNEVGDECGGFTWNGGPTETGYSAHAGFSFDRYKSDETVTLAYNDTDGRAFAGLIIQDRPNQVPLSQIVVDELHPALAMEDGEEKDARIAEIRKKFTGNSRVRLGRSDEGAALTLGDSKGRPRIKLYVDAADTPRFEMLDEDGNVTFSIPPSD